MEKKYPFSGTKHAHDIEFRRNRLKNEMWEGSTEEQETLLEQLTELLGYLHEGVCYIPGRLYGVAQESVGWAACERSAS